ncbi:hypothetical protein [Lentzea sp.]|uniref:hypothetical protein n=1 Tax=Lentzea sp. TaxID=56099 RepID=UPI002ECFC78A
MNDFLKAAASATADAPDPAALEALEEAGLGVADEIAEQPPVIRTVMTANPNRTKAPRLEVNR